MLPAGSFFRINTSHVKISCLTCTGFPLKSALILKILIFVHKIIHNCPAPEYIRSLITLQPKNDYQRSVNLWKAVDVSSKNSHGDRTFSIRGPKLWINLPINLRKISNHYMFRRELKSFLFTRYYQPAFRG